MSKAALRKAAIALRHRKADPACARDITRFALWLIEAWAAAKGPAVVAGYVAIADEIDPRFLLETLFARRHKLALPAVGARHAPLLFRSWTPEAPLYAGAHGTREPAADAPLVRPDFVLVPLLAFDKSGQRLGYGGGYYDRTLQDLRGKGALRAIGLAYSFQEVNTLPAMPLDERLDAVATEKTVHLFEAAK